MKIIHFIKCLVFPIIILCNNGYSGNTTHVHSNNILVSYKLLGNMKILTTGADHYDFPDSIIRCYAKPSILGQFSMYVKKELGHPDSQNIRVDIQNGIFSLPNNNLLINNNMRCGIVRFNDIYYLACYEVLEDTNEYYWWYLDEDGDYNILGTTPAF